MPPLQLRNPRNHPSPPQASPPTPQVTYQQRQCNEPSQHVDELVAVHADALQPMIETLRAEGNSLASGVMDEEAPTELADREQFIYCDRMHQVGRGRGLERALIYFRRRLVRGGER